MVDQCKQRGVLYHTGLVRDHGGHLVNQPCYIYVVILAFAVEHLVQVSAASSYP